MQSKWMSLGLVLLVVILSVLYIKKFENFSDLGPFNQMGAQIPTNPVNYTTQELSPVSKDLLSNGEVVSFEQTKGSVTYFINLNVPDVRGGDYNNSKLIDYDVWGGSDNTTIKYLGKAARGGDGFYGLKFDVPADAAPLTVFKVSIPSKKGPYLVLSSK